MSWAKIEAIEEVWEYCPVYDLTVDGEMYFVEGVAVHNCPHVEDIIYDKSTIPGCENLWRGQPVWMLESARNE